LFGLFLYPALLPHPAFLNYLLTGNVQASHLIYSFFVF
jgi:hypothetical protein